MSDADDAGKVWAVKTPKGQVLLVDLPLEVLEGLEAELDRRWNHIINGPAFTAKSAAAVWRASCAHMGCDAAPLTARQAIGNDDDKAVFVLVADDMPDMYEANIPKAVDGP